MVARSSREAGSGGRRGGALRERPSGPGAARALRQLAPLLDALVDAAELSPLAAARRLRRALTASLGWRARLVHAASPLASEDQVRFSRDAAIVPIAPGAGALRISGGGEGPLRHVAELCAQALARARAHPLELRRHSGGHAPLRVLVVAPAPAARAELASLLTPGAVAVPADGPASAAEVARVAPVDAAVIDLRADHGDLAALEALRGELASADLPALVVGGTADEATRLHALALGAEWLSPPFSAAEVRARLEHAVGQARFTRALRDEALTDPLTGLPNRRALEARLHEELHRARRYRTPLACVMADLDHLKPINDALGHASGDQALQGMASVILGELRGTDFVARAGGDEFLLLLPHTSAGEALALAERVRRRLATLRVGRGEAGRPLGASFGVAQLGAEGDGQAMVEAADRALYAAKAAGRSAVRLAASPGQGPPPGAEERLH